MSALFCVPLALIALYESGSIVKKNQWMKDWLAGPDAIDDESPEVSLGCDRCWSWGGRGVIRMRISFERDADR